MFYTPAEVLVNSVNIIQNVGIITIYLSGWLLPWRVSCWVLAIPTASSILIMLVYAPETPHFLLASGKLKESRQVLQKLRGPNYDIEEELAEMIARKETLDKRKSFQESKIKTIAKTICSKRFVEPFLRCAVPYSICQLAGATTIAMFMINIFQASGTGLDPFVLIVIVGGIKLICSVISTAFLKVCNLS